MLTDLRCRKATPREKAYKLADEKGLHLYVTPAGARSWRMKYRFADKERQLTFGLYPEVSLVDARDRRDAARRLLRDGIDPGVVAKQRKAEAVLSAEASLKATAIAWHAVKKPSWKPRYAQQVLERLEKHVFPAIGALPIDKVTPPLVLTVLRAVEATGAISMAHRVRQYLSDIFVFAMASGWGRDDPAHIVRKALTPTTGQLRPAVRTVKAAQQLLTALEARQVYAVTKLASRLLALTAARPGVVRLAAPGEFEGLDTPTPIWRIPAAKMKLTRERRIDVTYEFVIPLSREAVTVVRTALALVGPNAPYLFPSVRSVHAPISDNTLSKFYRDAGFRDRHVPHGWRATFSTVMNERAAIGDRDEERAIIDLMLAHIPNGVEAAYNRAAYMPRRRAIAQEWGAMLMAGMCAPADLLVSQRGDSPRAQRARRARDRGVDAAPGAAAHSRPGRATVGAGGAGG
jgi:integrase